MFMLRLKYTKNSFSLSRRLFCHKFGVKELDLPKVLEPSAIKNLEVLKNVKKVRKQHSFLASLFMGVFDVDFLTYPEVLYSRKEFIELRSQSVMINKYFRGIVAAERQERINQFNFNRLWSLSKCETLSVLEAIGESLSLKPEDVEESIKLRDSQLNNEEEKRDYFNRLSVHPATNRDIQLLIFDLILHNCLSFATIEYSGNETLKQRIKTEFEANPHMKIGFAWNERMLPLGALPYIDWESEAQLSLDGNNWVISGKKNRIMKQDYDYYLVFCRTQDIPDMKRPPQMPKEDEVTESPAIVAVLLRNDQIAKKTDEGTENGIPYESIEFQHVSLPREHSEVLPPQLHGVTAQNLKGIGHVATSAFILGQIKSLLQFVYEFLVFERIGLTECEMIQSMLAECTRKIYALESVTYMVGAMYDCFDHKQYSHIYLEAAAAKILAVDYAFDIIRNIQSIFGSKMLTTSPFTDLINILNSFLDGTVHNRMLIGLQGLKMCGQFKNDLVHKMNLGPFYPFYFFNSKMKNLKRPTFRSTFLPYDFKGYLHPTLQREGDQLEYALRLLQYITNYTFVKHAKEVSKHQCDVNRLSQIAIHIFELTCVLARASRAYCDGIQNGDCDVHLAIASTQDSIVKIESLVRELERGISETQEYYNEHIHNRNLKFKGYFPFPPLDKTFY